MSRSATSSPLRKKPRLSSPTYDAQFDELDGYDFQALDEIETSFSHSVVAPSIKSQSDIFDGKKNRRRAIEDALKVARLEHHEDSGIVLVNSRARSESVSPMSPPLRSRSSVSHASGFKSAAPLCHAIDHIVPDPSSASFLPVSLLVSDHILNNDMRRSSSPVNPPEDEHHGWFASAETSSPSAHTFTSASGLRGVPGMTKDAIGFDSPGINAASLASLPDRSISTWASPSVGALEQARKQFQMWESEIETEMSAVERDDEPVSGIHDDKHPMINRRPLKDLENSFSSPSAKTPANSALPTDLDPHSIITLRPFKAPAFTTPRPTRTVSTPSELRFTSVVSRSSAAAEIAPRTLLTSPSRLCPVSTIPIRSELPHNQIKTPQKARPLGLSPRSHAFTGSRVRPKFVTPFKPGIKLGDKNVFHSPHTKPNQEKSKGDETVTVLTEAYTQNCNEAIQPATHHSRIALVDSKLVPHHYDHEGLKEMGLDINLSKISTVSNFLSYRFNTTSTSSDPLHTQLSLGSDSALEALLAMNYSLATKPWVDNHWSLILWKMIGMACLEPAKVEERWCWDEVMRQLCYRYKYELASGSRPALKLIATQDAPSSGPLVLCISNIFWTDEYVNSHGHLIPAYPELEITDGWYRLRATVDEALARAARKNILRIGRKIACNGAKLESRKKDPMEVLDAYGSIHLILFGNSTHLAPWHAKLGFHSSPFVATLGSLTSDGGAVSLTDLIVMKVFPVGYIEFITTEQGETMREGPRTEKDEALEEDRWNKRRSNEAAKLQEKLDNKCRQFESYADRLEQIAGSEFCPTENDTPPDNIENLLEQLEDSEDPLHIIKRVSKEDAGWLSLLLRKKCENDREKSGDEFDRELASSIPVRKVRNFRVLLVKDARKLRKPSYRTAQLTVWDVMTLNVTEGGSPGSFHVGQRYLVSSLVPSHQSAWMGLEPGSEIYLSTRWDSKWKLIN